jgi:hypothetical protein
MATICRIRARIPSEASVRLDWNLGFAQLTSSTAYFRREQHSVSDYTQYLRATSTAFGDLPDTFPPRGIPGGRATFRNIQHNIYEEVRLTSPSSDSSHIVWSVGLFAAKLHENIPEQIIDPTLNMRARLKNSPVRSAIAHAELVDPKDYHRFAELGVVPVMSYQWAIPGPNSVTGAKDYLGPERFNRMEPMHSLAAAGARLAYGSDWPVDQMGYWLALKGGVARSGDGRWGPTYGGTLNAEPGISRQLALRSITMNSSWEVHQEKVTGSIETGKFADLIILDRNFMTVPVDDIPDIKVLYTMAGGKVVYDDGIGH